MEINLPNGGCLITGDNNGERIILMMNGLSIACEILPANDESPGTDAWVNKEIDLYEQALEIDLKEHRKFIADCMIGSTSL